jgi:hypothetical protein
MSPSRNHLSEIESSSRLRRLRAPTRSPRARYARASPIDARRSSSGVGFCSPKLCSFLLRVVEDALEGLQRLARVAGGEEPLALPDALGRRPRAARQADRERQRRQAGAH